MRKTRKLNEKEYSEMVGKFADKINEFQKESGWTSHQIVNAMTYIIFTFLDLHKQESPDCNCFKVLKESWKTELDKLDEGVVYFGG